MSKFIISSTALTITLGLAFAIFGFFSKTMFEDARAAAQDFRVHQNEAARIVAELKGTDTMHEQKLVLLEKKVDEANHKLDLIVAKLIR